MQGLFKVEFETAHGAGRGVVCARDGVLLGGNSAFAFVGRFHYVGEEIIVDISTQRHNDDPAYRALFGIDRITLALTGRAVGETYQFEGGTPDVPNVAFRSVMIPISEELAPPAGTLGAGAIGNGLYSIHIRMLDGIDGGNTGVMILHDGEIRGGDAFFDYIGAYSSANGRWKGEIVNHEHTPARGERPVFGGYEVGIGFSGSYQDGEAIAEATALAGKRSIRFSAVLRLLHAA